MELTIAKLNLIAAGMVLIAAIIPIVERILRKPQTAEMARRIKDYFPLLAVVLPQLAGIFCFIILRSQIWGLGLLYLSTIIATLYYIFKIYPASRLETCTLIIQYFSLAVLTALYSSRLIVGLLEK